MSSALPTETQRFFLYQGKEYLVTPELLHAWIDVHTPLSAAVLMLCFTPYSKYPLSLAHTLDSCTVCMKFGRERLLGRQPYEAESPEIYTLS